MQRRSFLKSSLALIAAIPSGWTEKLFRPGATRMRVKMIFPHTMTEAEWQERQREFVSDEGLENLVAELLENGEILKQEFHFSPSHTVWDVQFRSHESYLMWDREVVRRGLVQDPAWQKQGYRLEIQIT